jgi:hypothetical protein
VGILRAHSRIDNLPPTAPDRSRAPRSVRAPLPQSAPSPGIPHNVPPPVLARKETPFPPDHGDNPVEGIRTGRNQPRPGAKTGSKRPEIGGKRAETRPEWGRNGVEIGANSVESWPPDVGRSTRNRPSPTERRLTATPGNDITRDASMTRPSLSAIGPGKIGLFGNGCKVFGFVFPRGRVDPGSPGGGEGRHWLRLVDHLGIGTGFVFPTSPVGPWLCFSRERLDRRRRRIAPRNNRSPYKSCDNVELASFRNSGEGSRLGTREGRAVRGSIPLPSPPSSW